MFPAYKLTQIILYIPDLESNSVVELEAFYIGKLALYRLLKIKHSIRGQTQEGQWMRIDVFHSTDLVKLKKGLQHLKLQKLHKSSIYQKNAAYLT